MDFLQRCIGAQLNILICGGTGTGKTTLLNALSQAISDSERIVTIEDAAELQLKQAHVLRLEGRPKNIEGQGEISIRDLVRNASAHAARPDHRRRGSRTGGARHAPGDEHGSRRLADHGPCKCAARCACPHRDHGAHGRLRPAAAGDPTAGCVRARPDRASRTHRGRFPPRDRDHGGAADGVGRDHAAGDLLLQDGATFG